MGVGLPRARRHRGHRCRRPDRAAGVPALEPGAGAPSGADHDCDLGHHRRPGARAFQRGARVERDLARLDEPSRRAAAPRDRLLARAPGRSGSRAQCRARALAVALSHAHGDGHPRRRRRPPDDLGARAQHPADLRDRVRRRLVAGAFGGVVGASQGAVAAGPGRAVAPQLARRRDHRRAGIAPRGGRRLAALRARLLFSAVYLPTAGNNCCTQYSIVFTFVLLALVLAFRPQGLFGRFS